MEGSFYDARRRHTAGSRVSSVFVQFNTGMYFEFTGWHITGEDLSFAERHPLKITLYFAV